MFLQMSTNICSYSYSALCYSKAITPTELIKQSSGKVSITAVGYNDYAGVRTTFEFP